MSVRSENGPLRVGDVFLEKYQILGALGRGGHGCVYRALNLFMGREVAIKVLSCPDGLTEELRQRGRQEAALLGQLEHPNIVRVYDAGISDSDKLYIVMELLEGQTLSDYLRDVGPMGVLQGLRLVEALCEALECAHTAKAVHRDLKPANIFLTKDGTPKILDFGVAKIAGAAGFQTQKNMVVGTILYMSPEQIQGMPATPRSDLYALGLMAFEVFHGGHPLLLDEQDAIPDRRRIAWMQAKKPTPRLDRLLPDFPDYVARMVSVATVKPPGRRFESARQMGATARKFILRYETELSLGYRVVSGKDRRTLQPGGAPRERGESVGREPARDAAVRRERQSARPERESARPEAAHRERGSGRPQRESARPERESARRDSVAPEPARRELAGSLWGPPAPGGDTKPLYAMTFPGLDPVGATSSEGESMVSSTADALAAQSEPAKSGRDWAHAGSEGAGSVSEGADPVSEGADSGRDWAHAGPEGAHSDSEEADSASDGGESGRDWAHSPFEREHSASDGEYSESDWAQATSDGAHSTGARAESDWAHPASTSTSASVTPVQSGGAGRLTVGLVAALGFGVGLASLALMVPPQGGEATQGKAQGTRAGRSAETAIARGTAQGPATAQRPATAPDLARQDGTVVGDGQAWEGKQTSGPAQANASDAASLGPISAGPATEASPAESAHGVAPRTAKPGATQAPSGHAAAAQYAPARGAVTSSGAQASGAQPTGSQPAGSPSSGSPSSGSPSRGSASPASGLPPAGNSPEGAPTKSQQKTARSQNSGDDSPRRPSNPDRLPDSNLWLE